MKFTAIFTLVALTTFSQAGLLKNIGLDGKGSIANGNGEVASPQSNPIGIDTARPNAEINADQPCNQAINLDLGILGTPVKICGLSVNN
ncbi:hypothetical protein K7432_013824 [Basidiobolus ranarum]|uniref:Uncharacterized protein n=1 Tax=Basidiobolus ranarum TaxID=34480 RepID=A0ABR2WIL2_9FUNG